MDKKYQKQSPANYTIVVRFRHFRGFWFEKRVLLYKVIH